MVGAVLGYGPRGDTFTVARVRWIRSPRVTRVRITAVRFIQYPVTVVVVDDAAFVNGRSSPLARQE